jgi:RND family efflux transporter MFP subunit
MMSSKRTLLTLSLLIPFSFLLNGCAKQQVAMAPPPTAIEAQTLTHSTVADYSEYVGTLISRSSVTLQSQVSGQITAIYVKAGDRVRAGQPLLMVDPAQQQAAVASSAAAAQSQQAGIAQAQESLRVLKEQRQGLESAVALGKSQYERYKKLAEQNSASRQDVEQYQNALTKAESDLAANTAQMKAQQASVVTAQRQYQQAQSATRQQQVQLRYHKVVAPFTGVVGDIPVKLGNYVQPQTDLLSVTQNNQLELNISVPSERAADLKAGLPVEIVDETGRVLGKSQVSFVSPRVDTTAQTILIKTIFPNSTGVLKADQLVTARLIWDAKPGLQIPTQSVVHMGGRDFVYVMKKDDKSSQMVARQLPVTLGNIEGAFYVVQSGLKAGDQLIVSGIQKLGDGAPVAPQQP